MNLYCIKYQKITDNSTTIELKDNANRINRFYSNCVDHDCKKFKDIGREDLNCYLENWTWKKNYIVIC